MKHLAAVIVLITVMCAPAMWAADLSNNTYILRAGDTISVTVFNRPEFSMPSVSIRPDGKFMHPYAGDVVAAGKSPSLLADDIRKALLIELKRPIVSVSIIAYKQDWAFVTGAVRSPGVFSLREPSTIQQAVAYAGGFSPDADLTRALVITPDRERKEIDLEQELNGVPATDRMLLDGGYTLVIYQRDPQNVAVLGAVRKPGIFAIPLQGLLVSDALALAEGYTQDAAPETARFTRSDSETVTVNLLTITDNVNVISNVPVTDGDVLFVPTLIPGTISVLGEVVSPGVKLLPRDKVTRVSDAVALAGGVRASADPASCTLMRGDGSVTAIDLSDVLGGRRRLEADVEVEADDTLFIPELPQFVVLGDIQKPGRFPLPSDSQVSALIAVAGGLLTDPSRSTASIIHADGDTSDVDLPRILISKQPGADIRLAEGDTLIVKSLDAGQVAVLGAVVRPGVYSLGQAQSLLDLIAVAGLTQETGNTAELMGADGSMVPIDLDVLIVEGRAEANIELNDRDTLIVSSAALSVSVLGAVQKPLRYDMRKGNRLADAIAATGGVTPEASNQAKIIRVKGEPVLVNLSMALAGEGLADNPLLEDGDIIVIDTAQIHVAILGEVGKPGPYMLRTEARFSDAIAQAGGLNTTSRAKTATIMHAEGDPTEIDLGEALGATNPAANVALMDGDTILIQAGPPQEVSVLGSISKPQKLVLAAGERVSDIIARAGGLGDDADEKTATLMRADGTVLDVDLEGILKRRDATANVLLTAGDTLVIGTSLQGYAGVIGAANDPGLLPIQQGDRLADLLARAGGPTDGADLPQATLKRADGTQISIDLTKTLAQGVSGTNVEITNGDMLYVPSLNVGYVAVLGAVNASGRYQIGRNERFSGIIARASGLTPDVGIANAILMHIDGTTVELDVSKAIAEPGKEDDPVLADGDTLIINKADPVTVLGAVSNPGVFLLPMGARASTAIARAQGALATADLGRSTIIHRDGSRSVLDLSQVLAGGEHFADPGQKRQFGCACGVDVHEVAGLLSRADQVHRAAAPSVADLAGDTQSDQQRDEPEDKGQVRPRQLRCLATAARPVGRAVPLLGHEGHLDPLGFCDSVGSSTARPAS